MADNEKSAAAHDAHTSEQSVQGNEVVLPNSWKYRSAKVGPVKIPWYCSPESQITIVAFVCFLCPGTLLII